MVAGVALDAQGGARAVDVDTDQLHVHYDVEGIRIVSAVDPEKPFSNVHEFSFPPPFNLYVLPEDATFVFSSDQAAAITLDDLCHRVRRRAEKQAQQVIVYTVDTPVEEEEEEELCEAEEEESDEDDGDASGNEDEEVVPMDDDPTVTDRRD